MTDDSRPKLKLFTRLPFPHLLRELAHGPVAGPAADLRLHLRSRQMEGRAEEQRPGEVGAHVRRQGAVSEPLDQPQPEDHVRRFWEEEAGRRT